MIIWPRLFPLNGVSCQIQCSDHRKYSFIRSDSSHPKLTVRSAMAMKFGTAQDYEMKECAICSEGVQLADRLVVEKETMHKDCFKCAYCGTRLQVGNCAMELSFYNRYGPCFYCSLICAHLPTGEKEAKLKELGKQVRQPKKKQN